MASPNWANDNTTQVSGDGDVVVTNPSIAVGDFMIALCFRNGSTGTADDFDTPSGWTKLGTQLNDTGGSDARIVVFVKIAVQADEDADDFTFSPSGTTGDKSQVVVARITSTSNSFAGGITALSNSASGSDQSVGGENNVTFTGLTPDGTDALLIMAIAEQNNTNIAFTSHGVVNNNPSWTKPYDVLYDPSGTGLNFSIAYGDYASASATGNFDCDVSVNGDYAGFLVSINESVDVNVSGSNGTLTLANNVGSVTANADISGSTGTITLTGQVGSVATAGAKWTNPDKSDTSPTITNTPKS